MDDKESLGQISAAVGRVCLRFKSGPNAPSPQGQVFARCTFVGRGEPFFVPTPLAADGQAPPVVDKATGSPQTLLSSVHSEPVDITEAVNSQIEQDGDIVGNDNVPTTKVVVADLGFSLDTAKFELVEDALSKLDATVIKIELCLRHGGTCGGGSTGAEEETAVIGTASVRVTAILRGENEWTNELALGTYTASPPPDAEKLKEVVAEESKEPGLIDDAAIHDASSGLLEFGGSTSTIRVTLLANDDTADYTVGAGSLWIDGAEVTGVPESWKMLPPRDTEHPTWNDAIAKALSGQPRHEFSIWWGADPVGAPGDNLEDEETVKEFPAMRLDGGVLRWADTFSVYVPDEESVNVDSVASDSAADEGSQGQASSPAPGNGGGAGSTTNTDENPTPAVPRDPPTGTWSVLFPSFQTKSSFLHRTSIRELREALTTPCGGGDPEKNLPATKSKLHVILERREIRPEPSADEGKAGGKGGKKGGGKKQAAGKKGEAAENPPPPAESPWRCRAVIDLAPLARPAAVMSHPAVASGSLVDSDAGDSPLRAELRATLALAPPPAQDAPIEATADDAAGKKVEEATAPAVAPAAEEVKDTTASVGDVFVPSDVGPRKPPRDVDVELKQELDEFVQVSLEEYAKLFLEPGADMRREDMQDLSAQDREKHLFYALNSGGLYHSFLGRLKPRVQRVVRKRFGAVPEDAAEADAFISDLYVHLVEEAAVVLNHRIKNAETKATPSYITADADKSLELKVEHLGMLADDAEARGAREEAAARHEDRIEAATEAAAALEEWRPLLARSWEKYAFFSLRGGRSGQRRQHPQEVVPSAKNGNVSTLRSRGSESLDHAARCLEECLRVYLPGSDESLAAASVLAAVSMEQGQLDRAWALMEKVLEQRLPILKEGADGKHCLRESLATRLWMTKLEENNGFARLNYFVFFFFHPRTEARGAIGAIVSDDEPRTPRRTAVRVMHDACAWLLELGLPGMARRAFIVAEESERLAVKKAKERGLSIRTPTALRESCRRLKCYLILADEATAAVAADRDNSNIIASTVVSGKAGSRTNEAAQAAAPAPAAAGKASGDEKQTSASDGMAMVPGAVDAERLAQEAVELSPGDPRPWQALAEACDAQGLIKATEAADAWAAVLDRTETAWRTSPASGEEATPPTPALRVYMRLGSLYNTLGRIEEAKVGKGAYNSVGPVNFEYAAVVKACFLRACRAWRAPGPWLGCGAACLRLEQWQEAEDALQHASRLDCNSPLVWGHLALLLLSMGEGRLQEADRALSQALCLGLADSSLLREIGNCYVAVGRLDAAEEALRKSLAADVNSHGNNGNPHTRRCLGDVLSARNSTSQLALSLSQSGKLPKHQSMLVTDDWSTSCPCQAVEEYRRVLESPSADVNDSEREEVLTRCGNLLRKMGRGDEIDQLHQEALFSRQQQLLA
ncbi:unnamed protein product [Ectocarpus sp. CCAP 1310/34]|nr:unnamed protein product [Ectocarpus sp. CCAP 1310/34]